MKNNSEYADELELLYRYFRSNKHNPNEKHYTKEASDKILIDRAAFSSGNPSVNRAKLTRCPIDVKNNPSDGVMGIWTKDVLAIRLPDHPNYTVKVKITPDLNNIAHAEIVLLPEQDRMSRSVSRLFRKMLADISVCIIDPNPS